MRSSPLSSMISVRRSSPNFSRTALQLVDHQLHQQLLAREDRAQPLDRLHAARQLVEDLLALEAGQPLQLHVEDRLRLDLRQPELQLQALARLGRTLRPANQRDDLVEVIERDLEALEDVGPRLGLAQLELGAPADHLAAELDEVLEHLEQRQHPRPAADDRQHDDAEGRLQLRVLVEVVQDDVGHLAALQLDDDAHAVAIRFVAQVGDAFDDLLVHAARRSSRSAAPC